MQRRPMSCVRVVLLFAGWCGPAWVGGAAQVSAPATPQSTPASTQPPQTLPNAPKPRHELRQRTPEEEAARAAAPFIVNGRPYLQPTLRNQFHDYLRDSYGPPAFVRSTVRALYNQAQDGPSGWGQDFPGFMQRFGSNVAITAIDGNVRFGMERAFHEDLRYIPCHGCSVKRKLENALLSEVTARHDDDGRRFFTLTPAIADFSGPIIAHSVWYPDFNPFGGVVATRTVAATRVGQHLFTEFVLERRHHDRKIEDNEPLRTPPKPSAPVAP
jgi:hypothetical protein